MTTGRSNGPTGLDARATDATRTREDRSFDDADAPAYYVLGGGHVGGAVAERLLASGRRAAVVDRSYRPAGVPGFVGDPADAGVLSDAGIGAASTVVVATRSDSRGLLIAQLVRARFGVPRVIALVDDPDRLLVFAEAGHEPVCVPSALSDAVSEVV